MPQFAESDCDEYPAIHESNHADAANCKAIAMILQFAESNCDDTMNCKSERDDTAIC